MNDKQLNQIILTAFLLVLCLFSCKSSSSTLDTNLTPEVEIVSPEPELTGKPEEFIITEEIYNKTFDEIDDVIDRLNRKIAEKDFEAWKKFLSPSYVNTKSDSQYLTELSSQPKLLSQGIVLETLYDYFIYVIVPSRAKLKLSEIAFEDQTHVKAYSVIQGQKVILYYLELIDNQWKIGNW